MRRLVSNLDTCRWCERKAKYIATLFTPPIGVCACHANHYRKLWGRRAPLKLLGERKRYIYVVTT